MQKENVVKVIIGRVKPDVKISCHAELVSASSTHVVSQRQQQRQAWKTPNHYYRTPYYNLTGRGQAVRAAVWGDNPCLIMTHQGFTLIELLVVVLIIGILASVALPKYEMAVMRSRYATLKATTNALLNAEKAYHLANGTYSDDLEELSVDLTGCTLSDDKSKCTYPWGMCKLRSYSVSCENTQTLKNGYARYYSSPNYGTETCWTFTTNQNDKYNKLCKLEGGSFVWEAKCTQATNTCSIYKLKD